MNMEFKRKLPTPQTIRDMYPVSPELARQKRPTTAPCATYSPERTTA